MVEGNDYKEVQLLEDFSNGNSVAIKKLFELYYDELIYFVRQIIPNLKEAEDIASTAFLKLMKKRKDFVNLPNIKAYLFITARNAAFDTLRKDEVHERFKKEVVHVVDSADPGPEFEFWQVKAELLKSINEEINALPRQCKTIFTQFYIEHKNTKEIAANLHLAEATVRRQKQIALSTIRTALQRKKMIPFQLFAIILPYSILS